MNNNQSVWRTPLAALGLALGASLILSAAIASLSIYKARSVDSTLSVTGSARTSVVSDQAKWTMSISRQVPVSNLRYGYDQLSSDLSKVNEFFAAHKIAPADLVVSPVSLDEVYDYRPGSENREKEYNLRQTITLSSKDVTGIAAIAKDASSLARGGVIFQTQGLEYTYSKLPELRVSLLSDAIKDAKARAAKLAEPSGQKVGVLKSASLGVVQVMAPNSVDVSDYGQYDTSNVNKEVMVTVRASFAVR